VASGQSSTAIDFKHIERISRQQAADRLTDMAYALVVRAPATLQIDGERVLVPDADELLVEWDVGYGDRGVQLRLQVWWPDAKTADPRLSGDRPGGRL
jgi:hypothetical protein